MTPIFAKPRDGPPLPGFDPSKKCEHHFGAEGHTEQFDNTTRPNVITNPLPPHPKGNMNAISTVEEMILDFSSPSFPWKAILWALAQESHIVLENIGAPSFNWEACSFCDNRDRHALFDCTVLKA